jgi:hypothetical protein
MKGIAELKQFKKIVEDHKDLKGFSRKTIYRQLPDNQKRKYDFTNVKSNVSNDTFVDEMTTLKNSDFHQEQYTTTSMKKIGNY